MPSSSGTDASESDSESGDAEKEDVPESPKLDGAEVAFEHAASLERTKVANSQFEIMSMAWSNMQFKVASNLDRSPPPLTPPVVPAAASRGQRAAEAVAERHRQGQLVADELSKRGERAQSFAVRRHAALAHHENRQAVVADALEVEDGRRLERQQQMQIEQKHKTFIKQQQRSEQQKALKELQREQQRIYDDYYKKHHSALAAKDAPRSPDASVFKSSESSQSTLGGSRSLGSLGADKSKSMSKSMSMMGGASTTSLTGDASEDFYMETLRNHAMYAEKLEGAAQLVQENERRTEAHWRKMLLRTGGRRDDPHLVDRARGALLKRSSKDVVRAEGSLSRSRTQTCGSDSHSGDTKLPDLNAIRNGGSTPPLSPSGLARSRRDMAMMPCYRRLTAAAFSEGDSSQGHWKPSQSDMMEYESRIGAWKGKVAEARNRNKSHTAQRAGKAKSASSLWELRDREAKLKRAQAKSASLDPSLLNVSEEKVLRSQSNREELFKERAEKFGPRWEAAESVRQDGAALIKQAEKDKWLKQMNAEDVVTSNVKKKLGEWQVSSETNEHAEIAARKLEIKEELDNETRRNAKREIDGKDNKLQRSLQRQKTTTLEKEKRNKKSLGKLMRTPQTGSVDDLLEPLPDALREGEITIVPRPKVRKERRQATGASDQPHNDESDSSGEHEFLGELNGQCSQWLVETSKQLNPAV